MKRFLFILFLAFLSCSYVGGEEDKARVILIDPNEPNTNLIYDFPLWLYNHGYVSFYDSNWRGNYYGRRGAIVLRKPLSFGESFLLGLGKGISKGMDNYYRAREQKRDIKTAMALVKLKWASEGYYSKLKYSQSYERSCRMSRSYRMSPEEKQANLDRMKELDRIIEQKYKKREKLNEYLKSLGLPPVPANVEGHQVHNGEWVIYWDGNNWKRIKQEKVK